jgi:hypothetical protein
MYLFDSGMKKLIDCLPYKEPFASLAYNDDGTILAAGTSGGQVVFFDVRAKHQPFTSFRAYNSSEVHLLYELPRFSLILDFCETLTLLVCPGFITA